MNSQNNIAYWGDEKELLSSENSGKKKDCQNVFLKFYLHTMLFFTIKMTSMDVPIGVFVCKFGFFGRTLIYLA